jgi:hypothetical protein
LRRTPLALDSIGIDIITAETVFGCDQIRGYALRQVITLDGDRGINGLGAT